MCNDHETTNAVIGYPLSLADVKKIIVAAPTFRDRCVVKSLFWLGLRREEVTLLDIRDIDFDHYCYSCGHCRLGLY